MELRLDRISPAVRAAAGTFLEELAAVGGGALHSLYVVGSAATTDWIAGKSDINTLFLLHAMDLGVLEGIAPLGKRWRKEGIAAPLVMDTQYLRRSVDVFPMEFLELRLIHENVLGEDLLSGLTIHRADLRKQCEREVKSRLIGLGRGYLGALGDPGKLGEALGRFMGGYPPLARGILFLVGREVPRRKRDALAALAALAGPEAGVFSELLDLREGRSRPDAVELRSLFERCYRATERLGQIVDELPE